MSAEPPIAAAAAPTAAGRSGSGRAGRPWRRFRGSLLSGLAVIAAVGWLVHGIALRQGLGQLHESGRQRLEVEAARLDGQLARLAYLPSLLETSPAVLQLFEAPDDPALRDAVNRHLRVLNAIAGADNLYVLDAAGTALAAADFEQEGTPVGRNLAYRPYVRQALEHGRGHFYGVGITSARAGYYLSYAIPGPAGAPAGAPAPPPTTAGGVPTPERAAVKGIAAVKVNLEAIEHDWRGLPYETALVDERRVVILASRDQWRYHPIESLSAAALAEADRARRYGASDLMPVDWHVRERLGEHAARIVVDGRPYLASARAVNGDRWRLIQLDDERQVVATARTLAASAALATAVLLLALALARQRKREIRQRLASQEALQAAHDSLERKVQERTAELRAAQGELVHAGQLAVLGQMSAGMVHELNQPLAALNTLSDNAVLLIERGRADEAKANLGRIGQLVRRLGQLTRQLKAFAYKAEPRLEPVPVQRTITEVLGLYAPRLRDAGIETGVDVDPPGLTLTGDAARLEQVLMNLLGNAIDALAGVASPRITITARRLDGDGDGAGLAELVVANNGPVIEAATLARLFEPFVTTKPAGQGLGLGLMISSHIIGSFGGTITARNLVPAGVAFTIRLPRHRPAPGDDASR